VLKQIEPLVWLDMRRNTPFIMVPMAIVTSLLFVFILVRIIEIKYVEKLFVAYIMWWNMLAGMLFINIFLSSLRDDWNNRVWHGMLTYPISPVLYVLSRWLVMSLSGFVGTIIPIVLLIELFKMPHILYVYQIGGFLSVVLVSLILAPLFRYSFIGELLAFIYFLVALLFYRKDLLPILYLFLGEVYWKSLAIFGVLLILAVLAFLSDRWRYVS